MSVEPEAQVFDRELAKQDPRRALTEAFEPYRAFLLRMVQVRQDRRFRSRIDPEDVVQEAYLVASDRIGEFLLQESVPFYRWLRVITTQKLLDMQRFEGADKRSPGKELREPNKSPQENSSLLAKCFIDKGPSPSSICRGKERKQKLRELLDSMGELDREILILRHMEQNSTAKTAEALGLTLAAVRQRHCRALQKVGAILEARGDLKSALE